MTWDGLFASFGGIFGLCLGGSVLSLVELTYFFTIRLSLIIYRRLHGQGAAGEEGEASLPRQEAPNLQRTPEGVRHELRLQRAFADSQRIYTMTPILNHHYQVKQTPNVIW